MMRNNNTTHSIGFIERNMHTQCGTSYFMFRSFIPIRFPANRHNIWCTLYSRDAFTTHHATHRPYFMFQILIKYVM